MPVCSKCGGSAVLEATKRFHAIPRQRRLFCDECYSGEEKHEDFILLIGLGVSILLLVASIAAFVWGSEKFRKDRTEAVKIERQARDFDADGVVDIWEQQATREQINNFARVGYPCEALEGKDKTSPPMLAVISAERWVEIFRSNKNVRNSINYPMAMEKFLAKYTNPNNTSQLDGVFLTTSADIAWVIKKYTKPPSAWPPPIIPSEDEKKGSGKTRSKREKENEEEATPTPSPVPVLNVNICYEKVSKREARSFAQSFGVPSEFGTEILGRVKGTEG